MGGSQTIIGLVAAIAALSGAAVADVPISSRPTFDCDRAKSALALLICSGEETARADWDFKIAHWARNFSLNEADRAAFWKDQDKWSKSLDKKCRLSEPPFSRQQTSCVIAAYKERAALYRSKLSGDALAESKLTPEQLSQIQQGLITLGFFSGEADGEFGPMTRTAIRKYQEANGLPQSDFLSMDRRQALLAGGTTRSFVGPGNAEGNSATGAASQGTPPQSSALQQSAPPQSALAKPFAQPGKQYCEGFGATVVQVINDQAESASLEMLEKSDDYERQDRRAIFDGVVRNAADTLYEGEGALTGSAWFDPAHARERGIPGLNPPGISRSKVRNALVTAVTSLDGATLRRCFPKLGAFLVNIHDLKQQAEARQAAAEAAAAAEAQRQEAERRKQADVGPRNAEGSEAGAASQGTPLLSSPSQQPAPPRSATAVLAEPFAEPPKQYSIVEVANESRACRPAFSGNCITLEKGERVVVLASQIDSKPRRGLYCLRPMNMTECYYADLTAIEINGVPVPTIGMDKSAPIQRAEGPPPAPSQETPSPSIQGVEQETASPHNGTTVESPAPHTSSGAPDIDGNVDEIIRSKCQNDWPKDFDMRAYCERKQREGVQTLAQGRPKDVQENQFSIIRQKCNDEWPKDFDMRAYCERKQYEAVRQLRSQ